MPLQYTGVLDEHRACRERRGGVRRLAPRHRRVRGPGAFDAAPVAAHQRPRPDRARAGAVHASARSRRRARRRRHHRVVGRRRALPRDAERVEHRSSCSRALGEGRPGRDGAVDVRRHHGERGRARGAGPAGARPAGARSSRTRRPCRRFAVAPGRRAASSPAPATRARTASRSTSRADARPTLWDAIVAAGIDARRARRARHAAARSRPAAARPRARPGHHAAAGRARLGRRLGQGRLPRPRRARGRARAGRRPAAARPRRRGAAPAARGLARCCATAPRSASVTSGNFSPTLGHGIALAFVPPELEPGDAVQLDVRGQLLDGPDRAAPVR